MSARWTGFYHAYIDVIYQFRAGTSPGGSDIVPDKDIGTNESHTENGLSLSAFKVIWVIHVIKNTCIRKDFIIIKLTKTKRK